MSILEAVKKGRVHTPDERPLYGAAAREAQAQAAEADRLARRDAGKAKQGARSAKEAERKRPRLAPAAQLHPLLLKRPESWSSVPLRRERPEVLLEPTLIGSDLLDTKIMARAAQPAAELVKHTPERPAAYTGEAVIERLATVGVTVALAPDGRMAVSGRGGHVPADAAYIISTHAELIHAYLSGRTLTCSWCSEPATLSIIGGALSCGKGHEA